MREPTFTPLLQAKFTNEVMMEFAQGLDLVLRSALRQRAGRVPSQTIEALRYKFIEAHAGDISAKYELYFQDSGRHIDMKKLKANERAPVDQILDWVRRQGLGKFKRVPGYEERPQRLSEAKQLERIAAAIAVAKGKSRTRTRKQIRSSQWLNRNFYKWFGRLVEDFIDKQSEFLREATTREIKNSLGKTQV